MFISYKATKDLVILSMEEFDIILGMTSLSHYCVILSCYDKSIMVMIPEMEKLECGYL